MRPVDCATNSEPQPYSKVELERYETALSVLEKAAPNPSPQEILEVLTARDAVQEMLGDDSDKSSELLLNIIQLDRRLKKQAKWIVRVNLADWRASFNPPTDAWWWFWESRLDWLWIGMSVVCLTACLSLLVNIASRFWSGGPDTLGAFAVITPSILTLLTAKGALTQTGQVGIERLFQRLNLSRYRWQKAKFFLAASLFLLIFCLHSALPQFAVYYRQSGLKNYQHGRLASAESDYRRALALNPNDGKTHHYLGLLYEDLQDFEAAQAEYELAVKSDEDWESCAAAYNNLARLYILDGNYGAAVSLLKNPPPSPTEEDNVKLHYCQHKNLGWARLEQGRLAEARAELQTAIELAESGQVPNYRQASAHCLLAQVLEKKCQAKQALMEWNNCLAYATGILPEEDEWIGMAQERLKLGKVPPVAGCQ